MGEKHNLSTTRDILGASIRFNDFGHVLDVSFRTDFSSACLTGLDPGTTPHAVTAILRCFGFNVSAKSVRILGYPTASATKATLKVKDPLFAKALGDKLKAEVTHLSAVAMSTDARQTNCRKVHVSWHKATKSVWFNFGSEDVANRVAQRFNAGRYNCLGRPVKSSSPTHSKSWKRSDSHNRVPWTIMLSDIPGEATSKDLQDAILIYDMPRHIEMGTASYEASEAEVSVAIRSCLEEHGPLESFYLAPSLSGKRAKATAWFQDEFDAISACSLNNTVLGVLGKGRITVTLIRSAKVKVSTKIYSVLKGAIEEQSNLWRQQHLTLHVYTDALQPLTTLKIEGCNAKYVAIARRALQKILSGVILLYGDNPLWGPTFGSNGSAYEKLRLIEKDLNVVISRDRSKQRLKFHGPVESIQKAVCRISDVLKEESSGYEIDLSPQLFFWAMHGGFKRIEQILGKNVAVFNVVSKKITIDGTANQYDTALAMIDSKDSVESHPILGLQLDRDGDCPICFCEAEVPVKTSCKHTYCLECLGGYCEAAASSSRDEFQIRCCGAEGTCSTAFTLDELQTYLPSSVFELILKKSFEEYVKRRSDDFRSCPTPDCGHIYRCSKPRDSRSPQYTCPNCFEPLCTSCHAQHGDYTCAEYKDIASGGIEALEKLKKELNIKDCPKCKTPIEKTMGCNHMICEGCKAHICWVCMAIFTTSPPCYEHMNEKHGGIGLEWDRFMD